MEIKDLKVGDRILLYYYSNEFRRYKITKVLNGSVFYSKDGSTYMLRYSDTWVLDTAQDYPFMSDDTFMFIIKIGVVICTVCVSVMIGNALV